MMSTTTDATQGPAQHNPWHSEAPAETGAVATGIAVSGAAHDLAWALAFACVAPVWFFGAGFLALLTCDLLAFFLSVTDQVQVLGRPFSEPIRTAPVVASAHLTGTLSI